MKLFLHFLAIPVSSDREFSGELESRRKKNDFESANENGEVFRMHGMHGIFSTFVLVFQTHKAKKYCNCFEV